MSLSNILHIGDIDCVIVLANVNWFIVRKRTCVGRWKILLCLIRIKLHLQKILILLHETWPWLLIAKLINYLCTWRINTKLERVEHRHILYLDLWRIDRLWVVKCKWTYQVWNFVHLTHQWIWCLLSLWPQHWLNLLLRSLILLLRRLKISPSGISRSDLWLLLFRNRLRIS